MTLKHETYLVQRLKIPAKTAKRFPKEKWILVDGKLAENASELRQGVCDYDYMGSSEFEWGAIPKAIKELLVDSDSLIASKFEVKKEDFHLLPFHRSGKPKDTTFYIICRKGDEEEVKGRVLLLAQDKLQLKERTDIDRTFEEENRTQGWFELDNGFYFFTNREMWKGTFFLYTGRLP